MLHLPGRAAASRARSTATPHTSPPRRPTIASLPLLSMIRVTVAYERGQRWKAAGNQKKGIPPEYRDPQATRLALAWTAGFDGLPLPQWKD